MKTGEPIFIGVGNILRGDDGVGVVLAQGLKKEINIIDAGTTPENYLSKIIKERPSEIWIVDCLDFSGKAGEWKIFKAQELNSNHLYFTHNFSLELFADLIGKSLDVPIFVLGIQPKSTKFSQGLSKEVELARPEVEKELIKIANSRRD